MKRTGSAHWEGTGKEGKGTVSTETGVVNKAHYAYSSRFENGQGTNPEELIAAAHASCFSMKLSFLLVAAGYTPTTIDTICSITFEDGTLKESHLDVKAVVPGIDKNKFEEVANDAKTNCPVSKSLNTNITMEAKLE